MRILLFPLVILFRFFAFIHQGLYRIGLRSKIKLSKPVVSVGNLTVGGTGKTAVVDYLLSQFEAQGIRCCVLTRGYGRKSKDTLIVSQNSKPRDVGDEPLWLALRHPQSKILVSTDRAEAAKEVSDVDLFIMDDGLQHFELERDFEIILIDCTRPDWHYNLLPAGFARESWSAVNRADLVILTRSNQVSDDRVDELAEKIFSITMVDVSQSAIEYDVTEDLTSKQPLMPQGKRVGLVSAIANPGSFEKLVHDQGSSIAFHKKLDDHASYSWEMINSYLNEAKSSGVEFLLITEKDAVKWKENTDRLSGTIPPIGVVKTRLVFDPPLEGIYDSAFHHFR